MELLAVADVFDVAVDRASAFAAMRPGVRFGIGGLDEVLAPLPTEAPLVVGGHAHLAADVVWCIAIGNATRGVRVLVMSTSDEGWAHSILAASFG